MLLYPRQILAISFLTVLLVTVGIGVFINKKRRLQATAEQTKKTAVTVLGYASKKQDGTPVRGWVGMSSGVDAKDSNQVIIQKDGYFELSGIIPGRTYFLRVTGFNGDILCHKDQFEFGQITVNRAGNEFVDLRDLEICGKIPGWTGPEDDTTPPKIRFSSVTEEGSNHKLSFTVEDPAWGNRFGQILVYYRTGDKGKWQLAKVKQEDTTKFYALIPKANQAIFYFIQAGGAGGVLFAQYPEKGIDEPAQIAAKAPSYRIACQPDKPVAVVGKPVTFSATITPNQPADTTITWHKATVPNQPIFSGEVAGKGQHFAVTFSEPGTWYMQAATTITNQSLAQNCSVVVTKPLALTLTVEPDQEFTTPGGSASYQVKVCASDFSAELASVKLLLTTNYDLIRIDPRTTLTTRFAPNAPTLSQPAPCQTSTLNATAGTLAQPKDYPITIEATADQAIPARAQVTLTVESQDSEGGSGE